MMELGFFINKMWFILFIMSTNLPLVTLFFDVKIEVTSVYDVHSCQREEY